MASSSINDWKRWESSIAKNLKRLDSSTVTISEVPERLRRGKNDDYEPQIISFGPYHHGKPSLQAMEKYKWGHLDVILSFRPDIPFARYIGAIKEAEAKIRACYIDDDSDVDGEEFVEMMLIDGCFVVGYLLQFSCGFPDDPGNLVGMHDLIQYDILLLENKLPFSILIKIFNLLEFSRPSSFMDLVINYLNWVSRDQKVNFRPPEPVHPLHLFHSHQSPNTTVLHLEDCISIRIYWEKSDPINGPQLPSATVLYQTGVKFVKKEEKGSSILDVTFENGKMKIPPLVIDTYTKSRLRNLVAFEHFYPKFYELDISFTAYVQFMNFIVNTPEDVALLHKEGIIRHFVGSDNNVANFLDDLNQGVFVKSEHYLAPLYEEVHHYRPNRLMWKLEKEINKWLAIARLLQHSMRNPWNSGWWESLRTYHSSNRLFC